MVNCSSTTPTSSGCNNTVELGLVYQIHELTDEEKGQAMKGHAVNSGFELPEEVCDYLLRYEKRDMSYLIRIVDALGCYSLMLQRPITLPLLRQFLHEVL